MRSDRRADRRWITGLAGAYLALLYLAACAILSVFAYVHRQQIPLVRNYVPSPLPTPVVTPHILNHAPPPYTVVMTDNFDVNQYNWGAYYWFNKVEVMDGKLRLQSNRSGYTGLALSGQPLVAPNAKYYLQADLATDVRTSHTYGLVFGLDRSSGDLYLFELLPRSGGYMLNRYSAGKWTELIPFKQGNVKPYPEANTLGVYFEHGNIELFANGSPVATYGQASYNFGTFGAFVAGDGFTLIVDNFFAYNDK